MSVLTITPGALGIVDFSADTWRSRAAEIAHRTASVVRREDLSAAIAPFHYAICLVQCNGEGAGRVLERVLSQLTDTQCQAGIAVYPADACEPAGLIDLARSRMVPVSASAAVID